MSWLPSWCIPPEIDIPTCPICGDEMKLCRNYTQCPDCGYRVYEVTEEDDDIVCGGVLAMREELDRRRNGK